MLYVNYLDGIEIKTLENFAKDLFHFILKLRLWFKYNFQNPFNFSLFDFIYFYFGIPWVLEKSKLYFFF